MCEKIVTINIAPTLSGKASFSDSERSGLGANMANCWTEAIRRTHNVSLASLC